MKKGANMFKALKMKIAARRVEKNKQKKTTKTKKPGFWSKVWSWIRSIDLIGLVNLTLLMCIIMLFSMLIIDITKCSKKTVVFVATESAPVMVADEKPIIKPIETPVQTVTLPLKKSAAKPCAVKKPQPVKIEKKTYVVNGNMFIDGEFPGESKLSHGTKVNGNLYLQNMGRYTLPCDTVIEGDLFLRNVAYLKFCGTFTVKGNIYVSRNSSFGPLPNTARVGGQVIL